MYLSKMDEDLMQILILNCAVCASEGATRSLIFLGKCRKYTSPTNLPVLSSTSPTSSFISLANITRTEVTVFDLTWKILDTSKADQLPWEYFFKSGALASRAPTDFHWLKVLRIAGLTVQSWGWEVRKAGPWDASEERRVDQCWCICDAQHHLGRTVINN